MRHRLILSGVFPAALGWIMNMRADGAFSLELIGPFGPGTMWPNVVRTGGASREALIKSLSDFILGFLCNARNNPTRIASYLRRIMTKQCIKILMKSDSAN